MTAMSKLAIIAAYVSKAPIAAPPANELRAGNHHRHQEPDRAHEIWAHSVFAEVTCRQLTLSARITAVGSYITHSFVVGKHRWLTG